MDNFSNIWNVNTRSAARRFEKLASILNVLTTNQKRVGGIRVELRVRHNHLEDAIAMVLRPNAFTPECYGVTMQYYTISVPIYIGKARRIFALARAILTREGVMRHHVARLLTGPERNLFGDLKLLLGYRHAGYHTEIGAFNNWWRNDRPQPLRNPPRILQANPPPAAMDVNDVVIPNPVANRNPNPSPAGIYLPVTREMLDIDMFAVNLPTNDPRTLSTLIQFAGNTVMLSTSRGRNWHQEAWDFMVLTHNPIITLTINSQQVKEEMCNYFCTKGHVVPPSGEGVRHMVIGHPKPVPSATFLEALVNSAVPYIRLTNYGMKQAIRSFPDLPRDLLECDAADEGYPENEWDVSFSRRTQYLYMAKALPPVPQNVTVDFIQC